MKRNLQLLLVAGLLAASSLVCSRFSPSTATETTEPLKAQSPQADSGQVEPTAPPTQAPTETALPTGAITGTLNFPAEGIPPMRVVAFSVDAQTWFSVEVNQGNTFLIENLPAGEYTVVAYPLDPNLAGLAGGYSQFVPCGLSVDCSDHSLIPVTVRAGETTADVRPADWYAPEGAFPPDPSNQ